mmetsp:Transcript_70473/g.63282  ORF Transcript_70473/g.63282 Transcript_70473/m.63282 type:complete len:347 (+) Transcript_70473:1-1041(+)
MDKTEKKVLLTALRDLDMNGDGRVNENDIINYILMHGDINTKQDNAETKAKKFMSHVKQLSSYGIIGDGLGINPKQSDLSHISLHEIDIEGILDEIDEEDAKGPDGNEEIDEEEALEELKELHFDKDGTCNLSTTKSCQSATSCTKSTTAVRDKFDMIMDEDESSDEDDHKLDQNQINGNPEDEEDDDFDVEAVERHKLQFYNFSSAQSIDSIDEDLDDITFTGANGHLSAASSYNKSVQLPKSNPMVTTKISVERFSCIMSYADKEYDVQELVQKLQPTNSGNIPLRHINMFNGPIHSKGSNNKMMHDMIMSGLNSVNASPNSTDDEDDEMDENYVMLDDEDCIE